MSDREKVTCVCLRFQNAAPASFSSAVPLMDPSRPHPGIASWLSSFVWIVSNHVHPKCLPRLLALQ